MSPEAFLAVAGGAEMSSGSDRVDIEALNLSINLFAFFGELFLVISKTHN
jgi:hypothetical protein